MAVENWNWLKMGNYWDGYKETQLENGLCMVFCTLCVPPKKRYKYPLMLEWRLEANKWGQIRALCHTVCQGKGAFCFLETVKFISQRNVNVQKSLLDANSNVFDIVWMVLTLREKGSREIRARPNCRYSPNQYFPRQDLSWRLEIIGQWFSSPEYQLRTAESISIHADLVLK